MVLQGRSSSPFKRARDSIFPEDSRPQAVSGAISLKEFRETIAGNLFLRLKQAAISAYPLEVTPRVRLYLEVPSNLWPTAEC